MSWPLFKCERDSKDEKFGNAVSQLQISPTFCFSMKKIRQFSQLKKQPTVRISSTSPSRITKNLWNAQWTKKTESLMVLAGISENSGTDLIFSPAGDKVKAKLNEIWFWNLS